MVHITEFTADLIKHNKITLDPEPQRPPEIVPTFHDSCNPARGMGLLEEPRYCPQSRLRKLRGNAGKHHPRADLLLRRRFTA
jgi:Fe-S oxidoreductase